MLLESVDPTGAADRAQQLAAPYQIGADALTCATTTSVVSSQAGLATTDDYLRAADAAMYRAKSRALGVCIFLEEGVTAGTGSPRPRPK